MIENVSITKDQSADIKKALDDTVEKYRTILSRNDLYLAVHLWLSASGCGFCPLYDCYCSHDHYMIRIECPLQYDDKPCFKHEPMCLFLQCDDGDVPDTRKVIESIGGDNLWAYFMARAWFLQDWRESLGDKSC